MYSYEEKLRAVTLYQKYESKSAVIRKLGYPSRGMLYQWVKEYEKNNSIHKDIKPRKPKYNEEQIETAVEHYLNHELFRQIVLRAAETARNYIRKFQISSPETRIIMLTTAIKEFIDKYRAPIRYRRIHDERDAR